MNTIQLLIKAGQIVDELARLGPLSAAELAKAVSEPRPSVYRIVAALEQINVVRAAGDNRFELGTALLRWSDAAVESFVNRHALRKEMRWVRDQLGMNVYFCVPHQNGVLCLDHVDGTAVDMLGLGPGRILPRHAGAASCALMAFASPTAQRRAPRRSSLRADRLEHPHHRRGAPLPSSTRPSRGGGVWTTAKSSKGWPRSRSRYERADGSTAGAISVAGLRASVLQQETAAGAGLAGRRSADRRRDGRRAGGPHSDERHRNPRVTATPNPKQRGHRRWSSRPGR